LDRVRSHWSLAEYTPAEAYASTQPLALASLLHEPGFHLASVAKLSRKAGPPRK